MSIFSEILSDNNIQQFLLISKKSWRHKNVAKKIQNKIIWFSDFIM